VGWFRKGILRPVTALAICSYTVRLRTNDLLPVGVISSVSQRMRWCLYEAWSGLVTVSEAGDILGALIADGPTWPRNRSGLGGL
jgi:hypothetical protein